jgi:biopolymer transport protein ExbB/TolQ
MFQELSFWQMLLKGGATVILLMGISVLSWWIILDRLIRLSKIKIKTEDFMEKVRNLYEARKEDSIVTLCQSTPGLVPSVVLEALRNKKKDKEKMENAVQRLINTSSASMQSTMGILGTIGNVTPFIGLFGTVIGIMRAFHDLSLSSGGGPAVVASGIAEALVATAMGLFVAVPAVIFYNYFVRRVDGIETDAVNAGSQMIDLLGE